MNKIDSTVSKRVRKSGWQHEILEMRLAQSPKKTGLSLLWQVHVATDLIEGVVVRRELQLDGIHAQQHSHKSPIPLIIHRLQLNVRHYG